MPQHITQRELRNDSGEIMRRLVRGERFVVTRNGTPVAELSPLRRHRFVPTDAVLQAMASTHSHWVGRLAGERWALVCHPNLVKVSALYRLFATSPAELSAMAGQVPVSAALARLEG